MYINHFFIAESIQQFLIRSENWYLHLSQTKAIKLTLCLTMKDDAVSNRYEDDNEEEYREHRGNGKINLRETVTFGKSQR